MTVNYNFELEDDDFFADNFFSSFLENDVLTSTAISKVINKEPIEHHTLTVQPQDHTNQQTVTTFKHFDGNVKCTEDKDFNNTKDLFSNKPIESKNLDNQVLIVSPILDCNKEALNVNSRFVPGFTPKARKRKFPGPAGVYTQQNKLQVLSCNLEKTCKEKPEENLEFQDITSSQFTSNDLLLPSWQNLQKDVSSCQTLLSTAKYHSIHRVLNEASKKKLPKHVVVPVLCVLIKKFKPEDSSLVLIDDTGEILGKIYKDVLEEYKELIKVGSALILKKVTYLCNVLLLKKPCIASIYLEDGTVKHICELTSILDKEEPLIQMGCECPGNPKAHENGPDSILKMWDASLNAAAKSSKLCLQKNAAGCSSSLVNNKASVPSKQTNFNSTGKQSLFCSTLPSVQQGTGITLSNKQSLVGISLATKNTSNAFFPKSSNIVVDRSCSTAEKESFAVSKNSQKLVSMPLSNNDSKEDKDTLCEDFEMDEFDELLCNLDEKSFLE
ncbi:hypothetical protein JTE90_010579 [Oedothorax gibbosus]|uniref:Homologous recombination OB-fold protein OB-fold domain-containing protein n=1 Tax=Oedothorax gibbosus TaxID=931172 RepID=A0AAV6V5L5_9ARAC|nr:hypothetical protein JTE90_010579 [Oedothorax gibbosus]